MRFHNLQKVAAAVAVAGLLLPAPAFAQAPRQAVQAQAARQQAQVIDVALAADGLLYGTAVKDDGKPLANAKVVVYQNANAIAEAETNEQGQFAFRGLRGGSYSMTAGTGYGMYRVWTANAAPPSADQGLTIVGNEREVRGQHHRRTSLLFVGAAAAVVAVPIIVANSDDEDDDAGTPN